MNQEDANQLIGKTGSLLVLGLPQGSEFGIDCHSWKTGPIFKGVKLIPYGIHLIFYSLPNPEGGEGGARTSFFVEFSHKEQIIVKRWDPQTEEFHVKDDEDEIERYKLGVRNFDFDKNLGVYPFNVHQNWCNLSSFITQSTIHRLQAKSAIEASTKPLSPQEHHLFTQAFSPSNPIIDNKFAAGIPMDEDDQVAFTQQQASKLQESELSSTQTKFSKIPKHFWKPNLSPSQITSFNFDKTETLKSITLECGSKNEILGELQFSFLSFLIGQAYESFEHWKNLIRIICNSSEAIKSAEFSQFYCSFISLFEQQTKEIPTDFFEDIISGNNFLVGTLKGFFEILEDEESKLGGLAMRFKEVVEKRFRVSFSPSLDDEDAPVVVSVEEMRALGLTDEEIKRLTS